MTEHLILVAVFCAGIVLTTFGAACSLGSDLLRAETWGLDEWPWRGGSR